MNLIGLTMLSWTWWLYSFIGGLNCNL